MINRFIIGRHSGLVPDEVAFAKHYILLYLGLGWDSYPVLTSDTYMHNMY